MKDWAELPVSAQVKRIRRALVDVLPQWGLGKADLRFIFHGENTTFRAFTKRSSFLVRVHRVGYNSPIESESELAWAEALHHDTGLAPLPVRTHNGQLTQSLDAPGVAMSHVCVFKWVEGKIVGRTMGLKTLHDIGEMMARLHQHAAGWKQPRNFNRHRWETLSGLENNDAKNAWPLVPAEHRREFDVIRQETRKAVRQMPDFGLVHADLHRFNVLRTRRGICAIDFDDCGFAPWVYDLAVAGAYWSDRQAEQYASMLEGYQRVREFPGGQLRHLGQMIAGRLAGVSLWVTARAIDNATFRPTLRETQDRLLKLAREALVREYT